MLYKKIKLNERGSAEASMTTYFIESNPEIKNRKRPVVIVCPGGAYMSVSFREGEPVALRFLARGYHAVVLNYSVAPAAEYPTALLELGRTVQLLRENAGEWLIDPDRIILVGFSAGGHLAASYACFWAGGMLAHGLSCDSETLRPNALILGYPVISPEFSLGPSFRNLLGQRYDALIDKMTLDKQVTKHNPPTFLWHTETDEAVSPENSRLFAAALERQGVPAKLLLFPEGKHGLALADEVTATDETQIVPSCRGWVNTAMEWLNMIFQRRM